MSSIVFVLGAGASRQAGGPLMGDFLDISSDLLLRGAIQDKKREFQRVFNAIGGLQKVHSKAQLDLTNIESIFTALELGKVIGRFPGLEAHEIEEVIKALKTLIVKTLEKTILFPIKKQRFVAPPPYEDFAALVNDLRQTRPSRSSAVITFNYDLAIDYGLVIDGVPPDYVLESGQSADGIPLLKLHGSLNWGIERTEGKAPQISVWNLAHHKNQRHYDDDRGPHALEIGSKIQELLRGRHSTVEEEPVIVPPTWNKADYHRDLSDVWAAAADHLSEAEYIFIIGYSLPETDSFFRHLYALGSAGDRTLRKIIVFDPDETGAVDQRFKALMGPGARARYEYRVATFETAIIILRDMFQLSGKKIIGYTLSNSL